MVVEMEKAVWDYIHAYASPALPEQITFFDKYDKTLYRDVSLQTIGQHGWELVTVLLGRDPETKEARYEYFFKRNRAMGYSSGLGNTGAN
jgi:hypothetical protein